MENMYERTFVTEPPAINAKSQPNITTEQFQNVPVEIMVKILGCLGAADLLNCRLVCHLWDKECKTHLRKLKPIIMTVEKLNNYKIFVKNTNSNLNIPIKLENVIRTTEAELSSLESNVEYLITKFGQKTITSLTWFDDGAGFDSFLRILIKTCEGLEQLTLITCSISTNEAVSRQLCQLTLPNLKRASVFQWSGPKPGKMDMLRRHILVKSPLLEKLEIKFPYSSAQGLRPLLVETRTLQGHPFPSSFNSTISILNSTLLNELAPTLKTLGLKVTTLLEPLTNPFPELPHLEQLGIHRVYNIDKPCIYFDPILYGFTPDRLPALTKVVLPIGMFLSMDESMGPKVCFTSVTDLTIIAEFCCVYDQNGETARRNLDLFSKNVSNFLSTFPHTSKLSMWLPTNGRQECYFVRGLVRAILGCPLASSVQEFRVIDSAQDFVGQVLKEIDDGSSLSSSIRMTNVKTFCMEASGRKPLVLGFEGVEPRCTQDTLHLSLMAKYFPNMRNFQITFHALSFRATPQSGAKFIKFDSNFQTGKWT